MSSSPIRKKRLARKLVLQALYQWLMSGADLHEIEAQFRVAKSMEKIDEPYFCRLLHEIPEQLSTLEETFKPYLDRPLEQINPIELTILRICTFELLCCPELPYRIILDESVSLAKEFGSVEGHRYVNGVLHNIAKKVRPLEMSLS